MVFFELDQHADLSNVVISEASVGLLVVDASLADGVSLLLVLIPQFEVDSVLGVVIFPKGDSVSVHLAVVEALDVHVLVELRSHPHWDPIQTKAVLERVSNWNVVSVELETGERLGLSAGPLEEKWFGAVVSESLHIIVFTVESVVVAFGAAHEFESSEDEGVVIKVRDDLLSKLDLLYLVGNNLAIFTG